MTKKKFGPWVGWGVPVAIVLAALVTQIATRYQRPAPEVRQMLEKQGEYLVAERDSGAFAQDLSNGQVNVLGEASNVYLVERKDGTKYFVVRAAASAHAVEEWTAHGGRLFAINSGVNLSQGLASRISGAVLAVVFAGPVISVLLMLAMFAIIGARLGLLGGGTQFSKVSKPTLRFADVIGVREAKRELSDIATALQNRKAYERVGAQPPRGVLLSGPPGTGKTLLAKALAGESGASFIAVDGSSFTDKFVGMGVQRVRKLFETARENAPCVVFIDEIDGLGRRSSKDDAVSMENNRIINALLTELDGFAKNADVMVLAASNHPENVDPALLREGRFDRKCTLSLPPMQDRVALLRLYTKDLPVASDVNLDIIARRMSGAAPATIEAMVAAAARIAARENAEKVDESCFLRAITQQQLGSPSPEIKMDEHERQRTAYHEAGHAILAHICNIGAAEQVTIIPHNRALGVTVYSPTEDKHIQTETELLGELKTLLGGRAAELLVFGLAATGAANDLERASAISYRMIAEYGFSTKNGPFAVSAFAKAVPEVAIEAINEARELLTSLEAQTVAHLEENRSVLEQMAKALLERETLESAELDAMLAAVPRCVDKRAASAVA